MNDQHNESEKWKYVNNIIINMLRVVIICISAYLSVSYSYWWLLLLLLL